MQTDVEMGLICGHSASLSGCLLRFLIESGHGQNTWVKNRQHPADNRVMEAFECHSLQLHSGDKACESGALSELGWQRTGGTNSAVTFVCSFAVSGRTPMMRNALLVLAAATVIGTSLIPDEALARRWSGRRVHRGRRFLRCRYQLATYCVVRLIVAEPIRRPGAAYRGGSSWERLIVAGCIW